MAEAVTACNRIRVAHQAHRLVVAVDDDLAAAALAAALATVVEQLIHAAVEPAVVPAVVPAAVPGAVVPVARLRQG